MAFATITEEFKKSALDLLLADYNDSDSQWYIAIGRSEEWNDSDSPINITNTYDNELDFRQKMQSIKNVQNVSMVVPRVDWSSGTIYSEFDNTVSGYPAEPYYVMTAENDVYVCLVAGKASDGSDVASSIKPNIKTAEPFRTSDGYVWKYLYTVDNSDASKYLSGNFMPVKLVSEDYVSGDYSNEDSDQFAIQNAAVPGTISSVVLTNSGSGYSSAPTVTIKGDGTGASVVANMLGGKVVSIEFDSDGGGELLVGSGYTYATVEFTGANTTIATARVNVSPKDGFGANSIVDLRAKSLMFNSRITGVEDGKFFINQDFRQIGILRNPTESGSTTLYTDTNGTACRYIEYTDLENSFTNDAIIQGVSSGATAIVDEFYPTQYGIRLYFHQNDTTGYDSFAEDEVIQDVANTSNRATIATINNGDINPLSGDLLYIENRSPVDRTEEQTEDIKIIIKL